MNVRTMSVRTWAFSALAVALGALIAFVAGFSETRLDGYSVASFAVIPFCAAVALGVCGARRGFAYSVGLVVLALAVAAIIVIVRGDDGSPFFLMIAAPIASVVSLFGVLLGMGLWEFASGKKASVTD